MFKNRRSVSFNCEVLKREEEKSDEESNEEKMQLLLS